MPREPARETIFPVNFIGLRVVTRLTVTRSKQALDVSAVIPSKARRHAGSAVAKAREMVKVRSGEIIRWGIQEASFASSSVHDKT